MFLSLYVSNVRCTCAYFLQNHKQLIGCTDVQESRASLESFSTLHRMKHLMEMKMMLLYLFEDHREQKNEKLNETKSLIISDDKTIAQKYDEKY